MQTLRTGHLDKKKKTLSMMWDTRYFVLYPNRLSCYKNYQCEREIGKIILDKDSVAFISSSSKKMFTVLDSQQKWVLRAEIEGECEGWVQSINDAIQVKPTPVDRKATLLSIKDCFHFLRDKTSKQHEFWQVWLDHFPPRAPPEVEVKMATSSSMQKLAMRVHGPQAALMQCTIDFFWVAGAPDLEIDRLNDLGRFYNPVLLGSNMEMSVQGGMDGGWYFPVETPIALALESADFGHATRTLLEWADSHKIGNCFCFGRDMGASPPWQTEVRVRLKGDFAEQAHTAIESFAFFGFPSIPQKVQEIIELAEPEDPQSDPLCMSITTTRAGFARVGILIPKPCPETVKSLCSFPLTVASPVGDMDKLEQVVGSPIFAELMYLMEGFGYGVYQEGFDVLLHYSVKP
eukprot:Phypoly_transcript_09985.p1 GENE.Phypoly_transcript_09985~~Phypoly_transcript_09985.p1  ORF type:complete len:403 (+),score=59.91 Phypoly_transcript_09985:95-1303(+)